MRLDGKVPGEILSKQILPMIAEGQQGLEEQLEALDYYDGYQTTEEQEVWLEEINAPPYRANFFAKEINSVLGAETRTRTSWILRADEDEDETVAEASNVLMNEYVRLHDVDYYCSEAYADSRKAGIGWLYVGKSRDALGPPLDVHSVPFWEIIDDARSTRADGRDRRFICRRRFYDVDHATALWPTHKELIEESFSRYGEGMFASGELTGYDVSAGYAYSGADENQFSDSLYREPSSTTSATSVAPEVAIFEIYYRTYEERRIVYLPNGIREEYDSENEAHVDALYGDVDARVVTRTIALMRRAWYIGSVLIEDEVSPHPHNHFPYIPAECYREKKSGVRYGLGRALKPGQDKYNDNSIQRAALLERFTIIADEDALPDGVTQSDIRFQVHSTEGYIAVRDGKQLRIERYAADIAKCDSLMEEAREEMRGASGITMSFTGQAEGSGQSGRAIQNLAELSSATLAESDDPYRMFKRQVGILLFAHIISEVGDQPITVRVKNSDGKVKKTISLNERDESGKITNSLTRARMQVALDDISTSAGLKGQNAQVLREAIKDVPEQARMPFAIAIIENLTLPNKEELIAQMHKASGLAPTEEEQQAADQAASEEAAEMAELAKNLQIAETKKKLAEAELATARAQSAIASIGERARERADTIEQESAQAIESDRAAKLAMLDAASDDLAQHALH